jgi:hypothetical protein
MPHGKSRGNEEGNRQQALGNSKGIFDGSTLLTTDFGFWIREEDA